MELVDAKYISIAVLFLSNIIMIILAVCLHRFVIPTKGNALLATERLISCLTSGILLGTLLMLILPNSIDLMVHQSSHSNLTYILIGLGFFLICVIKEAIGFYEHKLAKKQLKTENEQLINPSTTSKQDYQITRLITLVFSLGVHYFFSGVLIGGQTDINSLWILLVVICLHMSLIAFSVTLRLLIDHQKLLQVILAMSAWSIMGSIGVCVSLLVSSNTHGFNLTNGILQCLSTGTFIYITFIDMVHDDLMRRMCFPFTNIVLIFIGFLIIVLISLWHKHPY